MNRRKGILAMLAGIMAPMLNAQEEQSKHPAGSFRLGSPGFLGAAPPTVFGVQFSSDTKSVRFTGDGRTIEITVKEIMDSLGAA